MFGMTITTVRQQPAPLVEWWDSSLRALRGDSWPNDGLNCRSALRLRLVPGVRNFIIGFRVVVSARTSVP